MPQPNEKKLVNRLFENLIRRCYHETRAILKNNLELLKTMAELWRELIEVPVAIIHEHLTSTVAASTANEPSSSSSSSLKYSPKLITGIQLFGIVLANQIEAYEYPPDLDSVDFYRALLRCMKNPARPVHASSAEVVGLLLRWLQPQEITNKKAISSSNPNKNIESEKFDLVLEELFQILSRLQLNLLITCVHRIQLNYPPISERFMTILVHNLPRLYGKHFSFSLTKKVF